MGHAGRPGLRDPRAARQERRQGARACPRLDLPHAKTSGRGDALPASKTRALPLRCMAGTRCHSCNVLCTGTREKASVPETWTIPLLLPACSSARPCGSRPVPRSSPPAAWTTWATPASSTRSPSSPSSSRRWAPPAGNLTYLAPFVPPYQQVSGEILPGNINHPPPLAISKLL